MFNDVYGVVNLLLTNFHIIPEKIAWLATPETAIPVIIAVDVWKTTPFMALLILAGLQMIPGDMYEAGAIDGATGIRKFFYSDASLHYANACSLRLSSELSTHCECSTFSISWWGARETWLRWRRTIGCSLIDFLDAGVGSATSVIILLFIMVFVVLYTRIQQD